MQINVKWNPTSLIDVPETVQGKATLFDEMDPGHILCYAHIAKRTSQDAWQLIPWCRAGAAISMSPKKLIYLESLVTPTQYQNKGYARDLLGRLSLTLISEGYPILICGKEAAYALASEDGCGDPAWDSLHLTRDPIGEQFFAIPFPKVRDLAYPDRMTQWFPGIARWVAKLLSTPLQDPESGAIWNLLRPEYQGHCDLADGTQFAFDITLMQPYMSPSKALHAQFQIRQQQKIAQGSVTIQEDLATVDFTWSNLAESPEEQEIRAALAVAVAQALDYGAFGVIRQEARLRGVNSIFEIGRQTPEFTPGWYQQQVSYSSDVRDLAGPFVTRHEAEQHNKVLNPDA